MMIVLPDDVTSPYRFSQHIKFMKMIPCFLMILIRAFWEIKGDATMATITDMGELRGEIFIRNIIRHV